MAERKQAKQARKAARKRPAKKSTGGRPPEFREEFCELGRNYALLGATDAEMAEFFGVSERTVNRWKVKFPEFCQSIKEGKRQADAKVASRLFERACGFSHQDTKFATFEGQITDSQEYTKHYPPDTTAAIFWLKNRDPQRWRDKIDHEVEFSGDITVTMGEDIDTPGG